MKAKKKKTDYNLLVRTSWGVLEESWAYIKTVVDIVREPVLILDKNLRVLAANDPFYKTFQVEARDTEKKIVYELGMGSGIFLLCANSWKISYPKILSLRVLKSFMISVNWAQNNDPKCPSNHFEKDVSSQPIILLAIEDITDIMGVADMLTLHTNQFEDRMAERTEKLEIEIKKLEKEIIGLKSIKNICLQPSAVVFDYLVASRNTHFLYNGRVYSHPLSDAIIMILIRFIKGQKVL